MYKNQLYRLNRDSNNYIWAKMKTDYIMTDYRIGRDGNDYFQGEIVETSSGYLYEIYKDGIGDYDTNEVGTERTYEELENNVILRPNGFGIKNFDRFYRTNEEAKEAIANEEAIERVYHIDSSETPLNNVFLKLQDNDTDKAKDFVKNGTTDWYTLKQSPPSYNVLISAYEDRNENFINCFDDPEFVEDVKRLWDLDSYMPSKYLIEHFEFLKGFMIEDSKRKYSNYPEFNLDPEEIVRIKYTDYVELETRQPSKDPNKELFTITIKTYEKIQKIEAPWWEAWYVEYDYKRNLFDYTDLEIEYLDKNYKKIFIDFVKYFSMHYNAPPLNFIRTVLK